MKKSEKSLKSCSLDSAKRAATALGKKPRPNKTKKVQNINLDLNTSVPQAPHNTNEFLMSQHNVVYYDPEELFGEVLGVTFETRIEAMFMIGCSMQE